ncbi:MAG TPA: S1C family serine protease [Candidatus Bilamarchaeum sp.]|nr:S1C family serine protease [Candidatus Bilamarchaeum sp.]
MKPDWIVVALAIVAVAAVGLFIIGAQKPQAGTSMALGVKSESAACEGTVRLDAELQDASGNRVPDARVSLYAGKSVLDTLYTDRNGRVSGEFGINKSWCGREIAFAAAFDGSEGFGASKDTVVSSIRAPSNLVLEVPQQALEGETFQVKARLTNALTGEPVPDKWVNIQSLTAKTDLNGTAVFNMSFAEPGSGGISANFEGSGFFEPSASPERKIVVAPRTCIDGTRVGSCAGSFLCSERENLMFDCRACGCAAGLMCTESGCISEEQRVEALIEKLQGSSVKIESDEGIGSGVIIARNGSELLILTNRHVVDADFTFVSNTHLEVINYTNETAKPVRVYIAPNQLDMAIVAVEKDIGPPAAIADAKPKVGAQVLVIGSPLGIPNSVSGGIISNYASTNTSSGFEYEVIQTDAAVNPGNSGGGVFLSSDGDLIGIISFKLVLRGNQLAEGLGFAIPANILEDYPLREWKAIAPN